MSKHRMPRWMNALWLFLVLGSVIFLVVAAIQLDFDFITKIGFMVLGSGLICALGAIVWGGLYGLSIVLEGSDHQSCSDDEYDDPRDMANFVP